MELAVTSSVRGSMKSTVHSERRVIQRRQFLFQRLVEHEKSDAPFKDTVKSFIELLPKGIGRLYLSEHSRTLGSLMRNARVLNASSQLLHLISSTTQETNSYSSQLFSVYDEETIFDTSFL